MTAQFGDGRSWERLFIERKSGDAKISAAAEAELQSREIQHSWNVASHIHNSGCVVGDSLKTSVDRLIEAQEKQQSAAEKLASDQLKIAEKQYGAARLAAWAAFFAALATIGLLVSEIFQHTDASAAAKPVESSIESDE